MQSRKAKLRRIAYPAIGRPSEPCPELPPSIFEARLSRLRGRMAHAGFDAVLVYGDREHFANLHWLTNYDPRFEEALLVVRGDGATPVLLAGNEGMSYSGVARLPIERRLYPPFSLLGQPRAGTRPLADLLRECGLHRAESVGVAGWKYFTASDGMGPQPEEVLDVPEFIARAVREVAGGRIRNAGALFMDAQDGLRHIHEIEQLAQWEWIATHGSQNLMDGLHALHPGMREYEFHATMPNLGLPLCCHPTVASGPNFSRAMFPSPGPRQLQIGDPMLLSQVYGGSNVCRFGWVARDDNDLPAGARDYIERAALPYFEALAAWYEALKCGATGEELHQVVAKRLEPQGFTLALNCGHQIAADEWTNSFVEPGNSSWLCSGMYWQCDFFASLPGDYHGAFAEDGVFIADEQLRHELAQHFPSMSQRIESRREWMRQELGIRLAPDVLPVSNMCGAVVPFYLSPNHVPSMA